MRFTLACAALLMATTRALSAQIATPSALAGARCSYASCALGLAPALSGLDVVRGASNERVGTLNFFWPHSVHALLGVSDSSSYHADRAFHARVIGAAFTDLAGILLAAATLRAVRDHGVQGSNIGLTLGGVALLGLSVPFQFGADGHLSRAVWWYNGTLGP